MIAGLLAAQLSAGAIVARAKQVDLQMEDLEARARMEVVVEGRTKQRVFDLILRRDGVNYRAVVSIVEPAEMEGTRFLVVAERGKRNEQWAYFPDLDIVRPIKGPSLDDPFLGSDITYNDLAGGAHLDDLIHRLVGEADVNGVGCYVMEGVPRHEITYGKLRGWVRKDNFVTVQALFFDREGEPIKQATLGDLREVDGFPLAHRIEMKSLVAERKTVLVLEAVHINQGLSWDRFEASALGGR